MSIKSLKCPNCEANLKIEDGNRLSFCPYCGNQIEYDDGVERNETTLRYVNEAANNAVLGIKEHFNKKLDHKLEMKKLQMEENERSAPRKTKNLILMMVFAIILLIFAAVASALGIQ